MDFKFGGSGYNIKPLPKKNNDMAAPKTSKPIVKQNIVTAAPRAISEKEKIEIGIYELENEKNKLLGEIMNLEKDNQNIDKKREEIKSEMQKNDTLIDSINNQYTEEIQQIMREKQAFLDSLTPEERAIIENMKSE